MKKEFNVKIAKINDEQININAHGQEITTSINGTKPEMGIVAPELVLSAYGACTVVNTQKAAKQMGIQLDDVKVELKAFKRMEPLGFEDLKIIVKIKSNAPKKKLEELVKKGTTNGTATTALLEGIKPTSELVIEK